MDKKLEDKLMNTYPLIFKGRYKSIKESSIPFGLECGSGWYWLIDNLCNCIQGYIDNNNKPQVEAIQVKEKFGGLRFYINSSDDLIHGMIWLAENLSFRTCESCGAIKDVSQTSGWIKTLCKTCTGN